MLTPSEEAQIYAQASGGNILPVGTAGTPYAQTYDRRFALSAAFAPTTSVITFTSIWLPAGKTVSGITFVSGAQAEVAGTHLAFALYRTDNLALLAQSLDDATGAAFAANTALRKALSAPVVTPYAGIYYICFLCTSGTNVPTLENITLALNNNNGGIAGMTPILSGTADTIATGVYPATMGARTAIVQSLYAFVD